MVNNKKHIVLFDFCETLVNFQTADAFIDYCRNQLNLSNMYYKELLRKILIKSRILYFLERITNKKYNIIKTSKLWQLKGLKESSLNELSQRYYNEVIKPNLIEKTCSILKKHIDKGDVVWIVSGGYGIYLKYFAEEYGIDNVISSNIEIFKGYATGKLNGIDCMCENKIKLLNNELKNNKDYSIIASYSDSITDIPILSVAENAYVISKYEHKTWIEKFRFNEIIWN